MQILEGNARKVGAVRFERVNHDDSILEAKEVTRLVPKIMKRKQRGIGDSERTDYDEMPYQKRIDDDFSNGYVVNEQDEYGHEHQSKQ